MGRGHAFYARAREFVATSACTKAIAVSASIHIEPIRARPLFFEKVHWCFGEYVLCATHALQRIACLRRPI